MGIFSKTPRSDDARAAQEGAGHAGGANMAADEASNVAHLSPFALKMQEKMHTLDGLKSRLGGLNKTFEQMNALAMESQNSIHLLTDFVEQSRHYVESEVRLKSENAKLSTDLMDAQHQVKSLSSQLEEAQAEVHSLRKRATETRTALETARNDLVSIRDNNKRVNEEYRSQSGKLVEANSQISELSGQLNDLKAKFEALEEHAESLKGELEAVNRREKELQQNLSESATLLEDEVKKNNRATNELEAIKRQVNDLRNENIDLKSVLDVSRQELAYSKSRLEEEQRKHDNEIYALNAEIENLSSQRRIGAQSLQDMARESTSIKERNRTLVKRMQEIELLLDSAQKNHEKDRNELIATSGKLREVNLRYNSTLTDLNHERRQNQNYAEQLEDLVEENKKLQKYKVQVDTANDQIAQLKAVIANYQMAMEGKGPAEELGLLEDAAEDDKNVVVQLHDKDKDKDKLKDD